MAIYIVTVTNPCQSARGMFAAYLKGLEENPLPDFMKELGIFITVDRDGYRSLQIISVKNDKLNKALNYSYANAVSYFYDVPGFNYQIDTCLDAAGALKMFEDSKLSK